MPPRQRQRLTRDEECRRILQTYGDGPDAFDRIMVTLERQFAVLHNRAQVLLGLCGVVISTTGFSGRLIAGTNPAAQGLVIAGLSLVLLSAAAVCWGVLHLRWLTMQLGDSTAEWLATSLRYRDYKTNCYRVGLAVMLLGLALYAGAIAIMLWRPGEDYLPPR
jgi:hypothetical protein